MKEQLRELIEKYGVELIWFDGEWVGWWTTQDGKDLYRYLRTIKPSIIINNRVGKRAETDGDFGTPEQEIPSSGLAYDWESCMTINGTWGFKTDDQNWKSTTTLLQNLVDIASKGGKYLLNIGPDSKGIIPQTSIDRLSEMGQWLNTYGESIYGSSASIIGTPSWGRSTTKGGKIYLHVFNWPTNGTLVADNIGSDITKCYLLNSPQNSLSFSKNGTSLSINVPTQTPNQYNSVVVVEFDNITQNIPSKIEAENFYSMHNIMLDNCSDTGGGRNIGGIDAGDYLTYTANVANSGVYKVDFRIASVVSNVKMELYANNSLLGTLTIPAATGGYQTWQTYSMEVILNGGPQTMKLLALTNGFNINWMDFTLQSLITNNKKQPSNDNLTTIYPNPTSGIIALDGFNEDILTIEVFDIIGNLKLQVKDCKSQNHIDMSGLTNGIYSVRISTNNGLVTRKIVKK